MTEKKSPSAFVSPGRFITDLALITIHEAPYSMPSPNPTEWQEPGTLRLWFRAHKKDSPSAAPLEFSIQEQVRCERMLAEIVVKPVFGFQFRFELGAKHETTLGPAWQVNVKASAPDRNDNDHKIYLRFPVVMLCQAFDFRMTLARALRQVLVEWVIPHEVDEMIEIEGNRVFDPHAPGGMDWRTP